MSLYLLIGPPNVGKGTLAAKLRNAGYNTATVSDILHNSGIKLPTTGLVPDEVVVPIIKDAVKNSNGTLVLDGFPRTPNQANAIFEFGMEVNKAVVLSVPLEVLIERANDRVICKVCREPYTISDFKKPKVEGICDKCGKELVCVKREDDKEQNVIIRYNEYNKTADEIIGILKSHGVNIVYLDTSKGYSLDKVL